MSNAINKRQINFSCARSIGCSSLIDAHERRTRFRSIIMINSRLTCMPLNALSDNLRIALCEKSSFFIGKFDVAKVYLWSLSIVHLR